MSYSQHSTITVAQQELSWGNSPLSSLIPCFHPMGVSAGFAQNNPFFYIVLTEQPL